MCNATARCLAHGLLGCFDVSASPAEPLHGVFSRITPVAEIGEVTATTHEVEVALQAGHTPLRFVVVSRSYEPALRQVVERALARDIPGADPVFIVSSDEGSVTVICPVEDASLAAVAIGVAEVHRVGTWDESPSISVRVNDRPYRVELSWVGTHASARVEWGAG
jgi:hypothetical protein